jgi:hypothetical protein
MYLQVEVTGTELTESLRSFVQWRLARMLGPAQQRLGVVHVWLREDRRMGVGEVACEIATACPPAPAIAVCGSASDVRGAVDAAAARMLAIMRQRTARLRTPGMTRTGTVLSKASRPVGPTVHHGRPPGAGGIRVRFQPLTRRHRRGRRNPPGRH